MNEGASAPSLPEDNMKFRILSPHYIDDRLLPEGTIIGDEGVVSFRDEKGKPLVPTHEMEPLDDEAKKLFEDYRKSSAGLMIGGVAEPLYPKLPDPNAPLMGPNKNALSS